MLSLTPSMERIVIFGPVLDKTWYEFLVSHVVYFLEKYDELIESVGLFMKFRHFTDQNEPHGN